MKKDKINLNIACIIAPLPYYNSWQVVACSKKNQDKESLRTLA
jgi:hypothetical protein